MLLTLTACHINLVAPYDDQFVKDAVTVQTDFDTLMQTFATHQTGPISGKQRKQDRV